MPDSQTDKKVETDAQVDADMPAPPTVTITIRAGAREQSITGEIPMPPREAHAISFGMTELFGGLPSLLEVVRVRLGAKPSTNVL